MLTFLMGTDTKAKREYIGQRLYETVKNGEKALLLVPEQENFNRDKELMLLYGEKYANVCRTTSFTHFTAQFLEEKGKRVKPSADEAGVSVLMSLALGQVSDSLNIYKKHYRRPGTVKELVTFYEQLKNAGLAPSDLKNAGLGLSGQLSEKITELCLIFTAFEGLVSARFSSVTDNINVSSDLLTQCDDFLDTDFYFDDFRGFTGAQIGFISALMPRCRNIFISITSDSLLSEGEPLRFEHALKNRRRLTTEALSHGIEVREISIEKKRRSEGLDTLRAYLFSDRKVPLQTPTRDVCIVKAPTRYEECDFIALKANELLLSGEYRARNMAVLYRDESYTPILLSAMAKYGVPAFADVRRSLLSFPLVRMLLCAVELAAKGFSTETVLSYLKTDVTGVGMEDYSALENYVYRWQIEGKAWEKDFTGSVEGYGAAPTEEDAEALLKINETRKKTVNPIKKLASRLKDGSGRSDAAAVFYFLQEISAGENFLKYAEALNEAGREEEAVFCAGVWDQCMFALDTLSEAVGETTVSPVYFYELLSLILSTHSIGSVPTGVDKVQCGCVDRVKVLSPDVVFLLGFSEGVFPRRTVTGGLLSSKELRVLSENDFSLDRLPEDIYEEERLILFGALSSPEKRIYLSYPAAGITGERLEPSRLLGEIGEILPGVSRISTADIPVSDKVRTPASAFSALSSVYGKDDCLSATLGLALQDETAYADRVRALKRAVKGVDIDFTDGRQAMRLFGKDIYLSASKAETYHKCPFMYYCRYGLGVDKINVSKIDARVSGLLVHEALEKILLKYKDEKLSSISDETLKADVGKVVSDYTEKSLGGEENLPRGIKRSIIRMQEDIFGILAVIKNEFNTCSFIMRDMELKIGDPEKGVRAYTLTLPDGGTLKITGSVDRVDTMEDGGQTFLRVIDYKTGGKEFRLSDVFEGLNMQMLIYLFALCDNGKEKYGSPLPAGILYVPAKTNGKTLERGATDEEVLYRRFENGRMNGVILENETVLKGMESAARGVFINAKITEKGEMKGDFLSLSDFARLHQKIDEILVKTGTSLHEGKIEAVPVVDGGYAVCDYCPYASVCLKEANCKKRSLTKLKHKDALEILREEGN